MSRGIDRRPVVLVTAAALVRLAFAARLPAFPDESYYWEWSRHLAVGYFDHPPAIAWLIRLGTALFAPLGASVTPIAVRFGAVVAGWIAALATVGAARRLGGGDAALRAAIIITVLPLAAAGLVLATPDAPLLAAMAVGVYCLVRVLETRPGSRESLVWWCATGVALGAAFWSKYTSIFFPAAVVLAIVIRGDLRARLREPGPYLACVVATILFLPVLLWNARHDWISFAYQIAHGLERPQGSWLRAAWRHEGDFFGGQAGLVSPILFILLGVATAKSLGRRASSERFVLAVVALVSFAFFIYSATRRRVEPNWPAPAYIPAIVLLATMELGRTAKRWFTAGVVFAGVMSLVIYAQGLAPLLPIPPAKDPIARAYGWRELTASAESHATAASTETGTATWLGGDRYQEASELAFHAKQHPATFAVNLGGRLNQYELWPSFASTADRGDNLVLVVDDDDGGQHAAVRALVPHFGAARRGDLVRLERNGAVIGTRRLWTMIDWRGTWPRTTAN